MQLRLINQWGECPQGGYRYVFPDDGYVAHAWTYVDWVQAARNHLLANGKTIPSTLEADMEHQLCLTLRPGYCLYDDEKRPRPNVNLEWNDVMDGLKTFARWVKGGCDYASQEEAERRAAICSRCYLNVHVNGCSQCGKLVTEVVGERKTKLDTSLRNCAVCKCFLRAKVHFPQKVLDTEKPGVQQMYPDFCWLKKDGENYRA